MADNKQENVSSGYSEKDIRSTISDISTATRAKLSVLIEKDGDPALRIHLQGALGRAETGRGGLGAPREVPSSWNVCWVMDRLEEAARVRAASPAPTRPKAFGTAWPGYSPMTEGEIRGLHNEILGARGETGLNEWYAEQNNRRRWQPSAAESSRAEEAELWPLLYLRDQPELAGPVMQGAQWASNGASIGSRLRTKDPNKRKQFFTNRERGLTIITQQLSAHRVPVT